MFMASRYAQWMYDWETRLTSVDSNRVIRPLEWGVEWARAWPCRNGFAPGHLPTDCEHFLREFNRRIVSASDEFYAYRSLRTTAWSAGKFASSAPAPCRIPG